MALLDSEAEERKKELPDMLHYMLLFALRSTYCNLYGLSRCLCAVGLCVWELGMG